VKKGHGSVFVAQSSVSVCIAGRWNLKELLDCIEVDKEDMAMSRK